MCYALEGIDYRNPDPFDIPNINHPRATIKRATYTLINAETYVDARKAITRQIGVGAADLIERVKEAHPAIVPHFHSGVGIYLQNRDSKIAVIIVKEILRSGYGIIPIHDSFVVPERAEVALRDIMTTAYLEEVGYDPIIKRG